MKVPHPLTHDVTALLVWLWGLGLSVRFIGASEASGQGKEVVLQIVGLTIFAMFFLPQQIRHSDGLDIDANLAEYDIQMVARFIRSLCLMAALLMLFYTLPMVISKYL